MIRFTLNVALLLAVYALADEAEPRLGIVGGDVAKIENHPWLVAILYKNQINCGGAILNRRFILTAAHCFHTKNRAAYTVRLGSDNWDQGGILLNITDYTKHPKYNMNEFDYGIIELAQDIEFSGLIQPVQMAPENVTVSTGDLVTAAGWGATMNPFDTSTVLRSIQVPVIDHTLCHENYDSVNVELSDGVICAGLETGGEDTCLGDSGGPLLNRDRIMIAVTYSGLGCAQSQYPGLYIRVSVALNWIRKHSTIKS